MKKKLLPIFIFLLTSITTFAQVNITFTVNSATIADVSPDGIFVAGGSGFGVPGDNPMTDNGDGTWSVTLQRDMGFSSHYTFLNGNCPGWDCKENLAGLPCSDPGNFNDRWLPPVMQDTSILACFGSCESDGSCTVVTDSVDITFILNTANIAGMINPTGMFIAGGGNFGNPGETPMTDNGDGTWTYVSRRPVGFQSFYTFLNGGDCSWGCKEDISGRPCARPDNFNDRWLSPVTQDTTILACFGNCADDGGCTVSAVDSVDVTFILNTELIAGMVNPTGMFIAGGGASFGDPGTNPMTDNGDGTWTHVSRRAVGFESYYTFLNGGDCSWGCKEDLEGLPCARPENFNDRWLPAVSADTTIYACFGNCVDNGGCTIVANDSVDITFVLNSATIADVSPDGIFLAGGGNFGNPGDNPMTDNGDGTWTFVSKRPTGFSSYYAFTNGNCPAWDCKENLAGLPCGDPNNFNDRFLPAVTQDTTVLACFGSCENDGTCLVVTDSVNVTFTVNTELVTDISPDGIFLAGGGNFGNPGDNPMTDDGNGTWSITVKVPEGFASYYIFTNGICPAWDCKEDLAGQECGDPNNFNDRWLPAVTTDMTVQACFGNCVDDGTCMIVGVNGLEIDETLFTLQPSLVTGDNMNVKFGDNAVSIEKQVTVVDAMGRILHDVNIQNADFYDVNTTQYTSGLYFLSVQTEHAILTKKFIVRK